MLRDMDSAEIAYQIAYDLVEAEERAGPARAPVGSQMIDLTDPDAYRKLKDRMGMH